MKNQNLNKKALSFNSRTKTISLFFFFAFLQLHAFKSEAQNNINLDLNDVTITEIFKEIESITDYKFIYKDKIFNKKEKLTIKAENESIKEVLDTLFSNSDIDYRIIGSQIVLNPKEGNATENTSSSSSTTKNKDQTLQVNGTVTDKDELPIPGVNIIEKGTANGTQTDFDGKFTIEINEENPVLVFSYVGYETQEIPIEGETNLTVVLKEQTSSLDEVVIVGYGRQKKVTLTGAVSDIKTEEIQESKTANLANNLQGRIPGLTINTRGGEPGSDQVDVRIRGIGTTGNTQPLYVIDGVPGRGSFERLNPDDIESI